MPRDAIPRHEFCFWLHDQCAALLLEASSSGQIADWHQAVSEALKDIPDEIEHDEILCTLAEIGGTISVPMKIDIFAAVLSDTLQFICEAMRALEERKFNVAFALLRKPLTENMLILTRLVSDDDAFIQSFADGTLQQKQLTNIDNSTRISIFDEAISKIPIQSPFSGQLLNDIIFSKSMPNGLQIRMQQATHLITTRHSSLLTPKLGINRIFSDQNGDENYSVYDTLPVLLLFILQLTIHKFSIYFAINKRGLNEILIRAMGIFGNMYEGRLDAFSRALNNILRDFFECEWCNDGNAKIRKNYSADFYLNDQIYCTNCGKHSHTPFTYLIRSGKIDILEEERKFPSEYEKLFGHEFKT